MRTLIYPTISLLIAGLLPPAFADAGFRPPSDRSATFVEEVQGAEIAVFPTIIRTPSTTRYSGASQSSVVAFLEPNGLGTGHAADIQFELGPVQGRSQYEMFLASMESIRERIAGYERDTDYVIVLEVLFPTGDRKSTQVFGIHCFVMTPDGSNAFSFLLNSHHEIFADASLRTRDTGTAAMDGLVLRSTELALAALKEQVNEMRSCLGQRAAREPVSVRPGVIHDFESELPSGSDAYGNPLGFLTFSGPQSSARLSTTTDHPPLPGERDGNKVLQLDLDVKDWAGVVNLFENEAVDTWVPRDWSAFQRFSFWLHGHNSGTSLFVDLLDNRNLCSKFDDAERYTYEFVDDTDGWKRVTVAFSDLTRKEIGNGAPDDGLGLTEVHGWGFGAAGTGGPLTFYIDDFSLLGAPAPGEQTGVAADKTDYPINELPMYGQREKTRVQKQADARFIEMMMKRFESRAEAAEYFAQIAWNGYYEGDKAFAIRRFNQAWLLDPDNRHALWGFAVISLDRGESESALRFYEMAMEKGPDDPRLMAEYEQVRREFQGWGPIRQETIPE